MQKLLLVSMFFAIYLSLYLSKKGELRQALGEGLHLIRSTQLLSYPPTLRLCRAEANHAWQAAGYKTSLGAQFSRARQLGDHVGLVLLLA